MKSKSSHIQFYSRRKKSKGDGWESTVCGFDYSCAESRGWGVGGREQATNEKHTDRKREGEGERSRLEISCTCKFAHNI